MENKKFNIGLDLDGVVACFWSNYREYLHLHCGIPMENMLKEPTQWYFYRDWNITDEQFLEYFIKGINDGFIFKYCKVIDNASYYINLLYQDGHNIHLISNRSIPGAEENALLNTKYWIDKNKISHHTLDLTNDKTSTVDKYDLDIFVEDTPKNLDSISLTNCSHLLLFNQKWNSSDSIYKRVYSWEELYLYIKNI